MAAAATAFHHWPTAGRSSVRPCPVRSLRAIFTAQGTLDTAFGTGVETFVFEADGHDQFWAGAYNAGQALFVGYKGAGSTQSEASNDDAWAVLLPLASVFADGFEAR